LRLKAQIDEFVKRKGDPVHATGEKDTIISNLMEKLENLRERERALTEKLYTLERENLVISCEIRGQFFIDSAFVLFF
jgi:hypothetical protein